MRPSLSASIARTDLGTSEAGGRSVCPSRRRIHTRPPGLIENDVLGADLPIRADQPVKTRARPAPDVLRRILQQRQHLVRVARIVDAEILETRASVPDGRMKARNSGVGGDPVFAAGGLEHVVDQAAGQSVARGEVLESG